MPYDSDRHSTRRTYFARTGALVGTTSLGMSALGSANVHDEKDDNDLEKKEPKDGGERKKEHNLFLTHFAELNGKNEVLPVTTVSNLLCSIAG
ncbi:hypothetical protein HAPAU_33440 [Halalkalicoccus paucihalophilus]|uniref:Uncharacterized protein n=2 Tax=Halalkalicoccus paucihalophilus TaxID=1008153 RepID=A0A151A9K4_9EURY|nr:hypothetical protein HAPAU_33440 [Halalkalicoccus paucihalophilus]